MSTLKTNLVKNDGSAVDLPNGAFSIGGNSILQGYTESATEPTSPATGDFWWDTANKVLYQYLNGEFKAVSLIQPWTFDVSSISYDSVSFSISSEESNITGFSFNSDGTKLYLLGTNNDRVYQYTLSTGFDISTASYDNVSFSFASQENNAHDIYFSSDGTKIYVLGTQNPVVYEYNLSTGFDISTASYSNNSFSFSSQETGPLGMCFTADGSKMYVVGYINDTVYQYSLSTNFDVSTASYDSVSLSLSSQASEPHGLVFDELGTKMYVIDNGTDSVYQYNLTTGYDLSTASYASLSFSAGSQDGVTTGLQISSDGTKMYICGDSSNNIYQYSTGL